MRDIVLDLTPFEEKISLHGYLKETLNFPSTMEPIWMRCMTN